MYTSSTPFSSPFARSAAAAYAEIRVKGSQAADSSGNSLVEMLFESALTAIARAEAAMQAGDIGAKGEAIGRAVAIVSEGLRGSLNLDKGGKLAADLDALYAYIETRLTLGNLRNDALALQESARLLKPLREAWSAIAPQVRAAD